MKFQTDKKSETTKTFKSVCLTSSQQEKDFPYEFYFWNKSFIYCILFGTEETFLYEGIITKMIIEQAGKEKANQYCNNSSWVESC